LDFGVVGSRDDAQNVQAITAEIGYLDLAANSGSAAGRIPTHDYRSAMLGDAPREGEIPGKRMRDDLVATLLRHLDITDTVSNRLT
jgi:hypothetical protein